MSASPAVSVVMSVFNGEAFLAEAVDSILGQSLTDLELVVVNDGSTDRSGAILNERRDPRLRVLEQENRGLTASLNRALGVVEAPLLARMDADDVSRPHRLARQLAFLEANPEVGLVGTWADVDDRVRGVRSVRELPTTDHELRAAFVRGNPFIHTSVMFRRALVTTAGAYDPRFQACEDYELWLRFAAHTELANLPETLVVHRHHWAAITIRTALSPARIGSTIRVRWRAHRQFRRPPGELPLVLAPLLHAVIETRALARARRGQGGLG